MNRIDRLLGIVTMLQSRKFVPAEKIAERFGISVRTVYRDIKALGEQGIPVSFEQYKGYFIVQGYFLPPVAFTSSEANALLLTETLAYGFADLSIQEQLAGALNKIRAVMRNSEKEKLESLTQNIKLQLPERLYPAFAYLSKIQQAITDKTILELHYKSQEEEITTRETEPIGLIFYAFAWHLIAWCHLRKDYRDFKIARIQGLRLTGNPFRKENHMTLEDYMKELPVNY